ncbi:NHLP bacteriocin export ABC transporter permease/ATPase subunit [Telmatospirillum sp.]|uniref:NHLP bacteriocin export ABC transporter permease/ATPase subunit n=1 Tax=Telmatospirillum sp. TaxID=2079197 RepID=UPI0028458B7C|nr:NHLP bacteriocin export ABC transporter permease/ATPase subunit [Telmatospirillum sp.]MDR3437884.1 NHLP bacteriocin export ABC transporter permease/ATPase subunit [Telmatospirillum sp.]
MTTLSITSNLDQLLDAEGTNLFLPTGTLKVFDDCASVWFLRDGSIDLFAVQRKNGTQTGPREHLCTLPAGSLVWGIDQSPSTDGIHLLALSADDTALTRVSTTTIDRWGRDQALAASLAGAVDQWITGLSRGVTKYISPRKPPRQSLAPGEELAVTENDRVISHRQVTWALLEAGNGYYIDIKEIGDDGQPAFVPLTQQGWLRAGSARSLRGLSTESVLRFGQASRQMDLFHGWIFYNLAYGFRNAAAMESSRLKRRAGWIVTETENTFIRFARLFDETVHRPVDQTGEDALFNCCHLVGEAMNATMVMPAFVRRRRAEEPPLSIEEIAAASQMRLRQVTLPARWWIAENGPLVAFRADSDQPVALLQRRPSSMVLHDPVSGNEQIVTEEVAATLSPSAYTFYASLPCRAVSAIDLLALCFRQCRKDLLAVVLMGALGGLIATAIPLATGYVFDEVIPGHQIAQMLQVAGAIVAATFAAAAFEFTRNVGQLRVEGRISGIVQAALMDRLLRLPSTFFSDYSSGDLAQRTMMVEIARKSLTGVVLGSLVSGGFSIFSFGLLIYYAPIAALLSALLVLVLAATTIVTGVRIMSAVAQIQEVSGRISNLALEIITGITKLRIAGAEERAFNNWGGQFFLLRDRENHSRRLQIRFGVFWTTYEVLCLTAIFAAVSLIGGSGMTTGVFLAFVAAFSGLLSSLYALGRSLIEVLAVVPLYRRAAPILATVPENDPTKADPGPLSGDIEVNGVFFRYAPDLPYVLKGLSLTIRAGELIAVVGPSGSGKSTLVRLLLGLNHPESGAIYLDGRDLSGLNLRSVRQQQGVVLQNGRLMPGSLYENIKGVSRVSLDDCWEAAAKAGLADDIKAMPMQMHTMLTDGASTLSGGQVQRLLIARALVGRPAIMLLDEATSALDNETQSVVMGTLDHLSITRIVIAHRLSTVMNADRIYVLENGKVAESGTYTQLMEQGGLFTALAYRQSL